MLITTMEILPSEANAIRTWMSLSRVMRLEAVQRVESILVLGTGKTDYKVLRKLAAEESSQPS